MSPDIDDGSYDPPVRPPETLPLGRLLAPLLPQALIRRWRALGRDRQRRAVARYLDRMDDNALRDIGYDRSEIKLAARELISARGRRHP